MFGGRHFPQDIILLCVRWYLAYRLSYRNFEEVRLERGIKVDHATINGWIINFSTQVKQLHRTNKPLTGQSIRMGETYIKLKALGITLIEPSTKKATQFFLIRKSRDNAAARAFCYKLCGSSGQADKVTLDKKRRQSCCPSRYQ